MCMPHPSLPHKSVISNFAARNGREDVGKATLIFIGIIFIPKLIIAMSLLTSSI